VSPGIIPFGVMLGITVVANGSGALSALVGAILVYGGSAQLTTLTVLHVGSGLAAAVVSGALVNARLLLYGAALEPRFRNQPAWFRLLAPQFILDQTYLSATGREGIDGADFRRYWAWLGGVLLVVWTSSVGLGLLIGPVLPPLPHLALVGTALFVAMLVPRLVTREALVAAAVAVAAAFAVARVVPEIGILGGTAAGVAAAVIVRERSRS
jgi:predicted branched-subunit amino acid permease